MDWRPLRAMEPVVCGRVRVPWEEGTVRVKEMLPLGEYSQKALYALTFETGQARTWKSNRLGAL